MPTNMTVLVLALVVVVMRRCETEGLLSMPPYNVCLHTYIHTYIQFLLPGLHVDVDSLLWLDWWICRDVGGMAAAYPWFLPDFLPH